MKIPRLYEINPFDNTEKVYESISGCTFKTLSESEPVQYAMIDKCFCHKMQVLGNPLSHTY